MENDRPLRVFLSYAHSDRDVVRALYTRMTRDGIDVWLDKEKLLPGLDWELEIRRAVRDADVMVVCLSKQFNQKGFRQTEVRIGLDTAMEKPEGEIFIIPARLEECDTLESLRKWHWVDLFEDDGYERLIRALRVRADKIGAALLVKKSRLPKITPPRTRWDPAVNRIQEANTLKKISNVSEALTFGSLESDPDLRKFWLTITEISEYTNAAINSETVYNRKDQLQKALQSVKQTLQIIQDYPTFHSARQAEASLQTWEIIIRSELQKEDYKEQIPNVYVAGSPLTEKSRVFKGRTDLFSLLERELATEAEQRPALLLFGARRTGKTSVLRQLPVALGPQVIPVMVDMQSIALANNASSMFLKIVEEIRKCALSARNLDLPEIDKELLYVDPYMIFSDWLKNAETKIGERWILLSFDEYEYIEKMLDDGRVDIRAFQLLRSLLQNYSRLTVLFSGSHTFEELKPIWSNYLINVRTIKIGTLEERYARELILHPIDSFPLKYSSKAIERIISTTAGQPYLLQATCRDLVNILNDQNRINAEEKDVGNALTSVLTSGSSYFYDLWSGDTNASQRDIMTFIAKKKNKTVNEATLLKYGTVLDIRRLVNHDLLEKTSGGYRFSVELVYQWVETHL